MRRAAYLTLSAAATGAVIALMCCGPSRAASAPPELVAVAHEVAQLPDGPGGHGHDCIWRTSLVLARLRGYDAHRQDVSWASRYHTDCHEVASVWLGEDEWLVDGQTGMVVRAEGEWAGPFHIDNCAQAMGR